MPRTLQEILDHGDELAKKCEDWEPTEEDERPIEPYHALKAAVQAGAKAQCQIAEAVAEMRAARYPWRVIGRLLGITGEAARLRYEKQ